ncbi:MAG: hypothetical protein ATN36_03690 [Epulopiscium sp. Nele67-Bin005]|nr:MAG: hypothetical protein ATN36_03690 [Epulopiscium sp. Nele67-Bin005]
MTNYKIVTENYAKEIYLNLIQTSEAVLSNKWQLEEYDDYGEVIYTASNTEQKVVGEILAGIICDIIQEEILAHFATKYLSRYNDISEADKKEIKTIFLETTYIKKEDGVSYISYYLLYVPILEFIEEIHTINVEGWLKFRTSQYQTILEDAIEQTIYDYEMQQDYRRFLNYLKEMRRNQVLSKEILHVLCTQTNGLILYDENLVQVTDEYIDIYCKDIDKTSVTGEDLFMHIMITLCPTGIVVHKAEKYNNPNFIHTLGELFEEQIVMCEGCDFCDREQTK